MRKLLLAVANEQNFALAQRIDSEIYLLKTEVGELEAEIHAKEVTIKELAKLLADA